MIEVSHVGTLCARSYTMRTSATVREQSLPTLWMCQRTPLAMAVFGTRMPVRRVRFQGFNAIIRAKGSNTSFD